MSSAKEMIVRFYRGEAVTLWTVQPKEAWEALQKEGVLRGAGRRAIPEFRRAYRWMMEQMGERIPAYSRGYPVWAWYYPKPDLRYSGLLPLGTRGVRIEFCVLADRVLLSDFEAWHSVLNGSYLALNEQEDKAFERLLPGPLNSYDDLPFDLQERIEKSWERVFDFESLRASDYASLSRYVQAVIKEIRLEDVRQITPFTAR
jgi:hypothetical protein